MEHLSQLSPKIDLALIEAWLQKHPEPDPRGLRFRFLTAFAEKYRAEAGLDDAEAQQLVGCLRDRMGDWLPAERIARDEWWMDLRWDDTVYEYGANNGGGAPSFYGFLTQPHWLMPLARAATLSNPTIVLEGEHLQAFLQSPAIQHLEILRISLFLKPATIEGIMTSGHFTHLRVLETPHIHNLDKAQRKQFHRWRERLGIADK